MAENSKIEWTDHTFNPWIGCQKVSAGCDNCYAENMMDRRYGRVKWGPHGDRVRTSSGNWQKPRQWDRAAKLARVRHRVFCASLADIFDNRVPVEWRADVWKLIDETPHLDWLLLTKRPENIERMLPADWRYGRNNVWLGTTCEDQKAFDRRWPVLADIKAACRFISYEPAIGPLRIGDARPSWVICGGESGAKARLMQPEWAYTLKAECEAAGVPFFMKQMTGKKPIPADLQLRQFPLAA